ncbi:MAG: GNAT family N-acetyltransferase [Rikenellaceae bacterium]
MVTRVRVATTFDPLFERCWSLYVEAFPEEERRDMEYQCETMQRAEYCVDAVMDGNRFIGILMWWEFGGLRYIEHFATLSTLRGGGYGAQILTAFLKEATTPIILEVEHPDRELNRRRITFYERLGFVLNLHDFAHPLYAQPSDEMISLMIMTYPHGITQEELQRFTTTLFRTVHFRYNPKY